jgi:hypothetical protein
MNKSKFLVVGKFQYILFLSSSLDGGLYFNFLKHYHGIFLSPHFSIYLIDTFYNVIISKVHYESTIFFSSIFLNMIFTKVYCNMDN